MVDSGDEPEGKPVVQRQVIDTQKDVTESNRLESRRLVPAHEDVGRSIQRGEWRKDSLDHPTNYGHHRFIYYGK